MTTPKLTREACAHCRTQSTPTVTLYSADSKTWWCGHCLLADRDRLREACEAALWWLYDPEDGVGHFERLAEEFRRDTGFMRPGKDMAAAAHQDPLECEMAWNDWRVRRHAKVLAELRAALAESRRA